MSLVELHGREGEGAVGALDRLDRAVDRQLVLLEVALGPEMMQL